MYVYFPPSANNMPAFNAGTCGGIPRKALPGFHRNFTGNPPELYRILPGIHRNLYRNFTGINGCHNLHWRCRLLQKLRGVEFCRSTNSRRGEGGGLDYSWHCSGNYLNFYRISRSLPGMYRNQLDLQEVTENYRNIPGIYQNHRVR